MIGNLKGFILFLFVLAAAAFPAAAHAKVFDAETFTLKNGMQVVVVPNHRMPVVTHMVWYRVGASDEPPGKSGIAHVLEHLMFKGTKDIAPGDFSKIVARNGGRDNAFTSSDYTGYFQSIAKDRLDLVMRIEADRMVNLTLDEKNFQTERDVVVEERLTRIDNEPSAILGERVDAALWVSHPYKNPIIGWEHELKGLTLADATALYRKFYAPNNAILVVGGDITAAELKPLAEKYYGVIPAQDTPPRVRPAPPPFSAEARIVMKHPRAPQPEWSKAFIAPSYKTAKGNEAYALEVLAELVGGGSTARLYQSLVVDKKLTASAGAGYNPTAVDDGTFTFYLSPRQGKSLAEAEAAMEAEIAKLLDEGVTDEEVERAKRRLRASTVYARDSLYIATRTIGAHMTVGVPLDEIESWPDRIATVTPKDVMDAARKVLVGGRSATGLLLPAERN